MSQSRDVHFLAAGRSIRAKLLTSRSPVTRKQAEENIEIHHLSSPLLNPQLHPSPRGDAAHVEDGSSAIGEISLVTACRNSQGVPRQSPRRL